MVVQGHRAQVALRVLVVVQVQVEQVVVVEYPVLQEQVVVVEYPVLQEHQGHQALQEVREQVD